MNWDHLRVFLGVMRSTSLRQAADRLGVSHPTIRRKLEALEEELNLRLFDRRNDGLHATPEAAELLELAEQVEASVHALGRRAMNADVELKGPVRVTVPGVMASRLLMPDLIAFAQRHPQIDLQVDSSYAVADLGAREADVAIRAMTGHRSPSQELTGRKVAHANRAIYGTPTHWLGWWGEERDREWVKETPFPDLPILGRYNDPELQLAACEAGGGLTLLPCFLADGVLDRLTEPEYYADLWVVVHPDLRRNPRLRIFRDEMVEAIRRLRPRLEGSSDTGPDDKN